MLTRRHFGLIAGATSASLAAGCAPGASLLQPHATTPRLDYRSNTLGDYIHHLVFRADKARLPAFQSDLLPAPRDMVLDSLISLAERTALMGLDQYQDVEGLMRSMAKDNPSISETSLAEGSAFLAAGAAAYPAFQAYWAESILPLVSDHIATWKDQDRAYNPLRRLTELHRLPAIAEPTVPLVLMPFHPAGSGTVSPLGLYTSMFKKPDLGWFLGHEATHIIWIKSSPDGWESHPLAAKASALAKSNEVLLEELPCWLFQAAMSRECAVSPPDFLMSSRFSDGPTKNILLALETRWPEYLTSPDRWPTSIDFVLETTIDTLTQPSAT